MAPGEANIARPVVTLPRSEFLDNAHIRTVCTRVQFNQGAVPGEKCPAGSIYGHAKAITPDPRRTARRPRLPAHPRRQAPGPRRLPAQRQGQHRLVGHVDSVQSKTQSGEAFSQIRNTFEAVPDAPVSSFVLEMQGGKQGAAPKQHQPLQGHPQGGSRIHRPKRQGLGFHPCRHCELWQGP